MRTKMTLTAAGDFMHYRMLPPRYDGFEEVKAFLERGDIRFFNLESVLPYIEIENDIVKKIELFPISLASGDEYWQAGLPKPGLGLGILERLREMSAPYGTDIVIREDGLGEVKL